MKKINKKGKAIKKTKKTTKKKKGTVKNIVLIGILSFLIFIVAVALIFFVYIIISAPEADTDKLYKASSSIILDKDGNEITRLGFENRDTVTYDDLPEVLVDAIVATEDSRFFQHNGFDIARFLKATLGQLTSQSGAGGGSTLTMQVVKNSWTNMKENRGLKGIIRKFTDIYMSIFIVEKKYTKQEIIEFYVNIPWLGAGNTAGVEQASQLYFGKSVSDLSLPEAALIAGLFNNANYFNPFTSLENATERRDTVLNLMYRHGYITEEQCEIAKSIPVESLIVTEIDDKTTTEYQHFINSLVDEVIEDTGNDPYVVPMRIKTTMDRSIQDNLNKLNTDAFKYVDDLVNVAVAIVSPKDGSVVGVFGGRGNVPAKGQSLATSKLTKYQPGSTIKPIMDYGPYMEYNNGSPYTIFFDEPMTYSNGQSIKNADDSYMGMLTMREALRRSRNIPALQAFQQLDINKISDFVHSLGIDYGKYLYESAAIGGFDGVNPLQMASAYAAFSNGGYYIEPYTYTEIEFLDTKEVITQKPHKEKVMSEETAYMITSILMTAFQNGVGGNFRISGTDIASKTGTSTYDVNRLKELGISLSASRDNWSITYSPDYVISLRYGYDTLMKDHYTLAVPGANGAARLMNFIAPKIYKTNSKFTQPSGVVSVEVESETIPVQLPSANTPASKRITELFKAGTEPSEVSKRYETLENPASVTSKVNGSTVTLSWQEISTPWAINETSLQEYFDNYKNIFGDTKWVNNIITKYYKNRLDYNKENIGSLIYEIYEDGRLLGSSTSDSYTINNVSNGIHTYTVKSTYSIFKGSASTGTDIKVKVGSGYYYEEEDEGEIGTITLAGSEYTCIVVGGTYTNRTITKIMDLDGKDITKDVSITQRITDGNGNYAQEILTNKPNVYRITYTVSYKGKQKNKTRTVEIANKCSTN